MTEIRADDSWSPIPGLTARNLGRFLMHHSRFQGSPPGCLIWLGARRRGVALMDADEVTYRVQDIAWSLYTGKPAAGRTIASVCGSELCVRPDHLIDLSAVARQT